MSGTARQVPIQPTNGASQCRRASAGTSTRGTRRTARPSPAKTTAAPSKRTPQGSQWARATMPLPIRTSATRYAEARTPFAAPCSSAADQRDRVGVDRHVLGGRGDGEHEDQGDEDDQAARGVGHGEEGHDERHHEHGAGHPVAAVAEALDQRRPEELQGERQLEEAEPADGAERGAVQAEVDRQHLPQDAHRAALDEVEEPHDAELGSRRLGQPAGAEQRPQEAHRAHCTRSLTARAPRQARLARAPVRGSGRGLGPGTLPGDVEDERRAAARRVLEAEVPAVRLQDLARHREAQARALAGRLRGEEPVEDLRLHLGRDAGPVVDDRGSRPSPRAAGCAR